MRKALAIILALLPSAALAQSFPSWLQYSVIGTSGQWISAFQSKQDVLTFTPCNTAGCSLTGELFLSPSAAGRSGVNLGVGFLPSLPAPGDLSATASSVWWQSTTPGQLLPVVIGGSPPTASG